MDLLQMYYDDRKKISGADLLREYELDKRLGGKNYDVNEDFINTYISDANSFLKSAEKDYGSIGWGNASSAYESRNATWEDLYSRSTAIRRWIYNNKSRLDKETYKSLSEALDSYKNGVSSTLDAFKSAKDYYGQWATEDAYNTYAAEQEWLKSDDFQEYSQKGREVANPAWDDTEAPLDIFGWKPFGEGETISNMVTFAEANQSKVLGESANALRGGGQTSERSQLLNLINLYMKEDEKAIYNYYIGKGEVDKANEYLNNLSDVLRYRQAEGIATQVDDSEMLAMLFAAAAGLDQFASGIRNIDNFFTGAEADPTSATQYASSMIREKLDGGWGVAYDAISTTANMLPSVLVSAIPVVGKPLGLATMGTSAVGNAYSEMKNLGYDDWQSRGYAALVGASEMVLQSLLGGISKLGGSHSASAAVSKLVSKVDNAFAKVAIKLGGNMASEGLEEAIQTALEPAFKALMTGEQFEGAEWDEILYSALLGALSAGVMEGAPTIYSTAKANIGAKKIYGDGKDLVAEGLEIGGNAGALAEKYQKNRIDKSKKLTGSQINHLIEANEQGMKTNDTGKIKSAAEARLTELGEKGNVSALADVITKHRSGGKLTRAEKQMLRESTYGRRVSNEANPDYIKSGGYSSEWATKIGTDRINDDVYNPAPQGKTLTPGDIKLKEFASAGEPPETKYEVSESGETTVGGEKVNIKEIASIKDGEITLRLDNGETVNASEVEFSSNDEGLLYESAIDMGLNAATANAFVKGFEPGDGLSIQEYVLGFWEAYRYGSYSIPMQEMSRDGLSFVLPEVKKSLAYNLGKTDAKYKITEKQNKVTEAKEAPKTDKTSKAKGKLYNTIKPSNERQRASLKALGVLADALGINIHIFESETDAKGKRIGKNGWYDPKTGDIYIDLYAGQNGESTMLFTASHELTHFIRDWSPAKFKVFADFLFEQYGEKGVSVSDLVRKQIEKAKKRGRTISYDVAYGEVVADACEMMLTDSNAIEVLAKLKAKDKSLWQKIKDFISILVARITKAYEGMNPESEEANYVKEMKDAAERLQALWTEALVDAGESYKANKGQSVSEDDVKYHDRDDGTDSTQHKINTSMTMAEAKRMIETAYKVNGIAEYYEDEYRDAEDWLKKAGSDEVEMYIENDYDLQAKYINSNEDILNEEYRISDVLEAYLAGTLIGKEKPKPKRLDVSQSTKLEDNRFYSPQKIKDAKTTFELAKQKAVGKDAVAINRARAEILLFAHNKGAAELLGITQAELNKRLRSWSNYSATAKSISEKINAGVAEENRWTGIENSSYINKARVTDEDIERLVASIEGKSKGFERRYIARVMLAADTHIDYSGLHFKFASSATVNADNRGGSDRVNGFYRDEARLIEVAYDKPNTVAHEMGHFLDAQWGRDLVGNSKASHLWLTHGVNADVVRERYGEPGVQFLNNFKMFINSLADVNSTYSSYTNDRKEIFARFFAKFIEWTNNIATGNKYYSYESAMYNDKFTQAQFVEFAKLLQEKALLDGSLASKTNADNQNTTGEKTLLSDRDSYSYEDYSSSDYYTNSEIYSYNFLTAQKEMVKVKLPETGALADRKGKIDDEKVLAEGIKNALSEGAERGGKIYVKNTYTGRELRIDNSTIKHGLDGTYNRHLTNARIGSVIGSVVKNAIPVNGLKNSSEKAVGTYAMVAYCNDSMNREFVAVITVEQHTGNVDSFELYDVAHAVSGRQKKGSQVDTKSPGVYPSEATTISIAHLLEIVNSTHQSILSDDVLAHFGETRNPKGSYSDKVLFSDRRAEVKDLRQELETANIEASSVIDVADGYFDTYGGIMNKSEMRYSFLHAMKTMTEKSEDAYERAYEEIVGIADELTYNPKDLGGLANDLREMKKHIRSIKFKVQDVDKPEFGIYDGFGTFRKKHMGKLTLANDGISVDSVYMELQELYGTTYFPDINNVAEQLMQIAKVVDTPLTSVAVTDYDPEEASAYTAQEIVMKFADLISSSWKKKQNSNSPQDSRYINYRDSDSFSTRSLLAGALESVAENDIEKSKLKQYKEKIALIESEQKKLSEIRAKAKELRFTKGRTPSETKQMRDLDFEANQIANRINTYDKQLLNLESTKALKNVLEREKQILRKRLEQKGKEALKSYKERAAQTVRELMTRNTESRKKAIEGRHKTEMRNKIKDVVSDLNKLLLNPTKEQHVPIGLQGVVAEALDAINMDTMNAEERVAYYNELIAKAKNPDEIATLTKKRDFFAYRDMNFKEKITALKNAYAEFKESDDPLIRNAHNDAIEELIKNTADAVGNKSLKDMSLEQLEAVYDMYKALRATVRNANKMFKEGRQETVTDNSEAVKTEVREVGGHKDRIHKVTKWLKTQGWNMLKPVYAMKMIGSDTFKKLYDNVRAGEDTWAVDASEAKEFYQEKAKKYNYKSWDFKAQHSFKDSVGNDFSLSLEQIMSLYAYSKREQADKHLEVGGFVFDDVIEVTEKNKLGLPVKYEVNDANPYRLRKEDLGTVIAALTEEQKSFIDEMQTYLSDVMGAKGNEVSLALYDIKLYKEKNYFPLKTAKHFREFDPEKNGTPKIKNSGFSKKTVPQAGNPIVLSNFMDVWATHVNDMSMYHAFVLPLEDFMRVYNYSSTAGGYDSVQQAIKNAYGIGANQYIETLMNDLNGGARVDPTAGIMNKMIGLSKKAAVLASASVVVQQPSAIFRAMALVDAKYFVGKPSATRHKNTWAEVKKYAPVAIIKEMGYFDTGMGQSTVEWLKGDKSIKDKVDDVLSKAPALADELTWCAIWKAVKRETLAKNKNLAPDSEEFLKRCGERFTEVVTETQVYDSVLARSGMMRSKDTGMKMATAFMAEPTTSLNMIINAIVQGKRGNKRLAAKAVSAVAVATIVNSALVSLVYAARDDDEDETYLEKYIGSVTTELIDGFNPLTYVPFVKDIWSIFQGYDVERSDMSLISDLWQSFENLFGDGTAYDKVSGVAGALASVLGVPLKNILRDAEGTYNFFDTITSGTPTTGAGIRDTIAESAKDAIPLWGRFSESKSASDKLYEAIMSGDANQIERLKSQYDSQDKIDSAIKTGLRENDPRIKEAAQARYDGNIAEYKRIAKEIIAEGNFSQDIVVGAINAAVNAIKKGETTETEQTEEKDEASSIYNGSDLNAAFESGDNTMALEIIEDLVKTKVANGKTEKEAKSSVRSSMTSYWKPLYLQAYKSGNNAEMQRIRKILYASGLYGSGNEVVKTVQGWLNT